MSGANTPISAISTHSMNTPRYGTKVLINSDNPGIKSYLIKYFTDAKMFAKIERKERGVTNITLQGHIDQFELTLNVLKSFLADEFGAAAVWFPYSRVADEDRLNSVTIEDTLPELKRDHSSGEFLQQHFDEISFGGSAGNEEIKKVGKDIVQAMFTVSSTIGRATGVIPSAKKEHITLEYHGEYRDLEVSTILSVEHLINSVNVKFDNPAAPICNIFRKENELVIPVTDVRDLQGGMLYHVLTKFEELPKKQTSKFSPEMEEFFEKLKADEELNDEDVSVIKDVFINQKIKFKQLKATGNLAITDEKLKDYGITQGGLRTAILSVIDNNR
jgi:hypothetical protein